MSPPRPCVLALLNNNIYILFILKEERTNRHIGTPGDMGTTGDTENTMRRGRNDGTDRTSTLNRQREYVDMVKKCACGHPCHCHGTFIRGNWTDGKCASCQCAAFQNLHPPQSRLKENRMTVEEMADCIVETVKSIGGGVTFAEIVNAIGEDASGNRQLGWPDLNLVLWSGVSEDFMKAFALAKPQIYPVPSQFLVYAMDGMFLDMPIAKQVNKPYKKPHWLPVVFWLRSGKKTKRLSDSRMDKLRGMK